MQAPILPQAAPPAFRQAVLWVLGLLGLVLGLLLFPLLTSDGLQPLAAGTVRALPFMFWMYFAAGLIAWWRRPRNNVGMLLVWAGMGVWLIGINNTTVPAFQLVGGVLSTFWAAFAHLMLAFPGGRLSSVGERVLMVSMYFAGIVMQVPRYLLDPPMESVAWSLSGVSSVAQLSIVTLLSLSVAAILTGRLARARPEHRLPLAVVYGYGMFVMVLVPLSTWVFGVWWPEQVLVRDSIQVILIGVVPVVVVIAFLLGGFRRSAELEALGAWLGESEASRVQIRDALSMALGDPSLTMSYWSMELRGWVDAEGLIVAAQDGAAGRSRHQIDLSGAPVAVIEYDSAVLRDPQEIERTASLAALALERERLSVELRASRRAVIESRERLFGAADAERRRIGRDLHDGLQARLVLAGVEAQKIATAPAAEVARRATALRDTIDQAADELRSIVHNLVPPALVELGVTGAIEELVLAMPIPTRLDAAVPGRVGDSTEMTGYLVVAEALTNVVKHAGATSCTVSLHADGSWLHVAVIDDGNGRVDPRLGTGLAGIADRVAATGGVSGVETQAQGGTRIWARIPYGS
ncbi:MAG: histidine kinase [Ottowia sp.]|uniref:sensor histidine kinase n=1 Tax=Ottowia sp. TaxID=1898956 RepID=UPI003C73AA65